MKLEVTLKVTVEDEENDLDMKLTSEDLYRDLVTIGFMGSDGEVRAIYEVSKEEFVSAVKQFEKGD